MTRLCLDTSVLVKLVIEEDGSEAAAALVSPFVRLVAPAFAWAELGSVLRKKVRQGLDWSTAEIAWHAFLGLAVERFDSDAVVSAAWRLAHELGELTLYDAAFLAVAEDRRVGPCVFWTSDARFYERARRGHPLIRLLS